MEFKTPGRIRQEDLQLCSSFGEVPGVVLRDCRLKLIVELLVRIVLGRTESRARQKRAENCQPKLGLGPQNTPLAPPQSSLLHKKKIPERRPAGVPFRVSPS